MSGRLTRMIDLVCQVVFLKPGEHVLRSLLGVLLTHFLTNKSLALQLLQTYYIR